MTTLPILIVEDEEDILELVSFNLINAGYKIQTARTGEEALSHIRSNKYSLILLDLMLPGIGGLEICKIIKAEKSIRKTPIIMVTAKGSEEDIVKGLELGVDDYITKPFSINVFMSRVRVILRRYETPMIDENTVLNVHGITINPQKHKVIMDGSSLELTYSEFSLLHLMAMRPGWAFTRNQIVDALRGPDYPITDRSVDVLVVGLRKKLGNREAIIETVRGVGYRMKDLDEDYTD